MNRSHPFARLVGLTMLGVSVFAQRPPLPTVGGPAPAAASAAEEVYVPEPVGAVPAQSSPAPSAPATAVPTVGAGKDPKSKSPGASAASPPPLSPRFQQIRDRIEVLFGHRNAPPPSADPRRNPFRPPGAAPVAAAPVGVPAENVPVPSASSADLAVLKQSAATLKVAGTIELGGRSHLIINQVPYKVGDVINVRMKSGPVFLRVKNISRYSYTLSLNAAELSVKY